LILFAHLFPKGNRPDEKHEVAGLGNALASIAMVGGHDSGLENVSD
jgi:hypothetical protein